MTDTCGINPGDYSLDFQQPVINYAGYAGTTLDATGAPGVGGVAGGLYGGHPAQSYSLAGTCCGGTTDTTAPACVYGSGGSPTIAGGVSHGGQAYTDIFLADAEAKKSVSSSTTLPPESQPLLQSPLPQARSPVHSHSSHGLGKGKTLV